MAEQRAPQRVETGGIEPIAITPRGLAHRREPRVEPRQDRVPFDPRSMRHPEQPELLVLARQLRHAQALLPERLEHRLPLRRPIRKPACEAQPGARPIHPIHLLVEHRSLDVASEPLLERGLGLGMLREELAHHGEVGLDRLARLERGKRHVFGRTVLGGGQAVVLLECARVIDARVALGRGP